jgi:hypothetical protein
MAAILLILNTLAHTKSLADAARVAVAMRSGPVPEVDTTAGAVVTLSVPAPTPENVSIDIYVEVRPVRLNVAVTVAFDPTVFIK